jgi:hypothetical protein
VVSVERVDWRKMFESIARFCSLQKKSVRLNCFITNNAEAIYYKQLAKEKC